MTDLHIDCSHARLLAAELARCCAPSPAPEVPPQQDVPATAAFHERLRGSVSALHQRHDALAALGYRLAEDSLASVSAIEEADSRLAAGLGSTEARP
ncbi:MULTISPECIES: hypothetical protein [unclassified Corynebacterium]|uniref:hypothetical protein n=1 Tax=unclassified Corynebacterium TaxID=2624378 RepID=UPI0029CAA890|nr:MULTISPECIES: hypothetical protein [unclassified Corynebacterium]WPF66601.1 hypothetical protein OLX12_02390 [Corynebacterium sp. 22KM0430]WPF69089.1 hypothetical protein OLW90_02385 [Corynebacterium sp. 21KM1197]